MRLYLSLGANLGNRGETLREALRRISVLPMTRLVSVSAFYETAPWGKLDQPGFINAAAAIDTDLEAAAFLQQAQQIERALGRVRHEHWGARTLDIDLLCGTTVQGKMIRMATAALQLPHPYLTERAFVLIPLRDIAEKLVVDGRTIGEWCEQEAIRSQQIMPAAEINAPYPLQLIACVDEARGLGRAGQLLVRLPEDMAYFRQQTQGQIVVMGRKTFESLPGAAPLSDRINLVLSRTLVDRPGIQVCRDITELWQALGQLQLDHPDRQIWGIGGAEIYELLLPYTSRIVLTEAAGCHDADTFFPALKEFQLTAERAGEHCRFCNYQRSTERDA